MSNTATETELPPLSFQNDMHRTQFTMLNDMIVKRNDLVGKANAANGDRQTLTEQIRDNSTDPQIVELREAIAQAILNLDELVKPQVDKIIADSEGSVKEIEEEIKSLDSILKPGMTFFKKIFTDGSDKHFATQERLKGASIRTGAGGRRIRGFRVIITVDGTPHEFENFASAAKYLDTETSELQNAFFAKAGTETVKDVADEVNVTLNFEAVDGEGNKEEKEALVKFFRTDEEKARLAEAKSKGSDTEAAAPAAEESEVSDEDEVTESAVGDNDDLSNAL